MERWQTTIWLAALALGAVALAPRLPPTLPIEPPEPEAWTPEAEIAEPEPPPPAVFLAFEPLTSPRRLPQRAASCTQAPPGGTLQYQAIDAARRGACATSIRAIQAGMEQSIDHCTLLRQAWHCFAEHHQRPLETSRFTTFAELDASLHLLQGTEAEHRLQLAEFPELATVPPVYHPAADGLEARLDAFGADPQLQHFVLDLFGSPTVADHLSRDLMLEAEVAVAIARMPADERTRAIEAVWARRVYVLASALHGDVGAVVVRHRKEVFERVQVLLTEAVGGEAPPSVKEALAVALGEAPLPRVP